MGRVEHVNLLLDTHTWFWAAARPEALSVAAADAIADARNDLARTVLPHRGESTTGCS